MSYPRNAATPPIVVVGVVVQISDGAVQTTGASVRVKTGTGAWGAGAGTLACDTTSGVWTYAPTQGETNDEAFHVAVYKSACIPAGVTVITSASATAGYAGTDQSKITNATATVNLSNTTIKTATDVETDTADIQSRLPAALVGGRIDANMQAAANDVITAAVIATGAIDADALASDAANEIADALLLRNVSNVEATAGEHTLCTLILSGLEWSVSGTTWTIKRTDGSTTHYTKTMTTDAAADHVTGVT